MQIIATSIIVLAGLYLTVCIVLFGRRTAGYRHLRHTISELGEMGAPHQRAIALGVFLPVGLLLLAAAGLLYPTSRPTAALALCIAVGYLVASAFPCDPGSPASGTARQGVHNLGGAVEYVGGGAALMALAETHGGLFQSLGLASFAAAALLTALPSTSVRGLVQRLAETALFAGLVMAATTTYGGG